jgi:uncharacterized phage protein (TIGR02218 family)
MKTLGAALASHVAEGVTTLCRCWRIGRRDGIVMGFTDFDRDIAFEDVVFKAASGFTASVMQAQLGLSVSNLDVSGAISPNNGQLIDAGRYSALGLHAMELEAILSPSEVWRYSALGLHAMAVEAALSADVLTEGDLSAGRYDDAEVSVYLVNWANIAQRAILRRGNLGQVSRGKVAFSAEVRGLAARLDQPAGRIYQRTCAWDLGDARCKIDLNAPGRSGSGTVSQVIDAFEFLATGISGVSSGALARGRVVWTSGESNGLSSEIKAHSFVTSHRVALMLPAGASIAAGDQFIAYAGCDKAFATCRDRFANGSNYGGFPHIPGNDFALSYPNQGDGNDGGKQT